MKKFPPRTGSCYVDVYNYYCYENELPESILVHGVLHGIEDLEGWVYGHAWIEVGDIALQPVKKHKSGKVYELAFINRKEVFYDIFGIEEKTIRRYNKQQVVQKALKYKHFGPWHELGLGDKGFAYEEIQLCEKCNTMKNCIFGVCGRCRN